VLGSLQYRNENCLARGYNSGKGLMSKVQGRAKERGYLRQKSQKRTPKAIVKLGKEVGKGMRDFEVTKKPANETKKGRETEKAGPVQRVKKKKNVFGRVEGNGVDLDLALTNWLPRAAPQLPLKKGILSSQRWQSQKVTSSSLVIRVKSCKNGEGEGTRLGITKKVIPQRAPNREGGGGGGGISWRDQETNWALKGGGYKDDE